MILSLIAAAAENNVIGKKNALPWDLPDDLAFFRDTTRGAPVVMGRKTYDSIGRPLPKRRNIVVTRQADWTAEGVERANSLEQALEMARTDNPAELFVIGGRQIYELALPLADRIYLTRVHTTLEGDAFFPELGEEWVEVSRTEHPKDDRHAFSFDFLTLERLGSA